MTKTEIVTGFIRFNSKSGLSLGLGASYDLYTTHSGYSYAKECWFLVSDFTCPWEDANPDKEVLLINARCLYANDRFVTRHLASRAGGDTASLCRDSSSLVQLQLVHLFSKHRQQQHMVAIQFV